MTGLIQARNHFQASRQEAQAANSVLHREAEKLLNRVPAECKKYVEKMCREFVDFTNLRSFHINYFVEWLRKVIEGGDRGHQALVRNIYYDFSLQDTYGWASEDEACAALDALEKAWAPDLTISVRECQRIKKDLDCILVYWAISKK